MGFFMGRSRTPLLIFLALYLFVCVSSRVAAGDRLDRVIDRGIEYLLGEVERKPKGTLKGNNGLGQVAFETYALVVAGVSVAHPLIQSNFGYLHSHAVGSGYTYTLACYVFALDAAIAQIEADVLLMNMDRGKLIGFKDNPKIGRQYRPYLTTAIDQLVKMQRNAGGWRYTGGGSDYDNSNTQFAVLALGAGAKRNVPIDPNVWEQIVSHFINCQETDGPEVKERLTMMEAYEVAERRLRGKKPKERVEVVPEEGEEAGAKKKGKKKKKKGKTTAKTAPVQYAFPRIGTEGIPVHARGWRYAAAEGASSWNMTCAGLSSLLLARSALITRTDRVRNDPKRMAEINTAIRDGFGWLMSHWAPKGAYYGAYSLEKVADIGEVKNFGDHDWYAELSQYLLDAQQPDGSWPKSGHSDVRISTAFALLILNRASSLLNLMSKNPLNRIVVSGRHIDNKNPNDHSWVYVPELETTVHYPTLLRTIRRRPHPKLLEFLTNIVEHYPDESKGELIPDLARVRDELKSKKAQKRVERHLTTITGHDYKNWEDYLKWHRRWERVILIGTHQKQERVPDLLRYYKSTQKSAPLKKTIMWALERCRVREAIPLFLEDLRHGDPVVRLAAYNSFRAFFIDFPPPFDPTASEAVREKQISKILEWRREQEEK